VPLICYVHINKNAGNSIIEALYRNYPDRFRQFLVSGRRSADAAGAKTVDSGDDDVRRVLDDIRGEQRRLSAIALNLPVGLHRKLDREVTYFTLMRAPVDRCVSYWYWAYKKRETGNLWATLVAGIGRGDLPLQFRNDQTRFLSGTGDVELTRDHLELAKKTIVERFAFVGAVERFDDCQQVLVRRLGWTDPARHHLNRGDRPEQALLPAFATDLFAAANALDQELYTWLTRTYLPPLLNLR
jgi:Sulfotransferase family